MRVEGPEYSFSPDRDHSVVETWLADGHKIELTKQNQRGFSSLKYWHNWQLLSDLDFLATPQNIFQITARLQEDAGMLVSADYERGTCIGGKIIRYGYDFFGPSFIYGFHITPAMNATPFITDANTGMSYDPHTMQNVDYRHPAGDEWEIHTAMKLTTIHLKAQGLAWLLTGGTLRHPMIVNLKATEYMQRRIETRLRGFMIGKGDIELLAPLLRDFWTDIADVKPDVSSPSPGADV